MISLGIESTSHTFGIGIVDDSGNVLANEKSMYAPALGSGIIPAEAGQHHKNVSKKILKSALEAAKLQMKNIDIISYSAGPGLSPPLLVGANFALELAKKNKKPLIPVNHPVAHLEIGKLTTKTNDPVFLYLSGGNTQIIAYSGGYYRVFGETLDIPIGNALDVLARELGLKMPGGPEIEKLAKGSYVKLPYVVRGMNFSFSGILTDAEKKFREGVSKESLCFSMQETCFAMLTEATERAMAHTGKDEVLLIGGVAANKRMQSMVKQMCEDRDGKCFIVPEEYSGDQGAMVAWTGLLAKKSKSNLELKELILPNWRVDQVEIKWLEQ